MERGDYQVIRADNNQVIGWSELPNTVESGMILEMSIILRQETAFQNTKEKCPRCGHVNLNVTANRGWIEWKVLFISGIY